MSKVKITIITAAYNAAKTIEQLILSVKKQSYRNIEHIIVDGGSSDGTQGIVRSYKDGYPLQFLSESDRGISDALNKGMRLAKGNYILVLQADDRLYQQDSLKRAVPYLENESCDIYTSPVLMEFEGGRLELIKPLKTLWCHRFKTPFRHQGSIVHRRIFQEIGWFSEDFSIGMDYDFFYRAFKLKPHIIYRSWPLSVMASGGIGSRKDSLRERLDQEYMVQKKNETSVFWKVIQDIFRMAYLPYKVGEFDFSPAKKIFSCNRK